MKEPERLLRGGGATEFERSLLESVQHERPSPELTARMERALGIALVSGLSAAAASQASAATQATLAQGAGTSAAANMAAGNIVAGNVIPGGAAAGVAGKLGIQAVSGLALKVGAGAVVAAGVAVSAVTFIPSRDADVSDQRRAPAAVVSAPGENVRAAEDSELAPVDTAPLREEIVLLDQARSALARGDAAAARLALAQYRESFPRGALLREARVLWARAGAGPWRADTAASGAEGVPRR